MNGRILCVDDEEKILSAFRRQLGGRFVIVTAVGPLPALDVISANGPFAVIVSDMRMPGMDGVQFLAEARKRAPDSVRVILTGFADLQTAVEAVNEVNIFRFLTKPCSTDTLAKVLEAGLEQYRLITSEKELLEKTLSGAIKVLTEVLSLTNPAAFGHASRVERLVREICRQMHVDNAWQCEVAATLSQIGCVTVPLETLEKVYRGETVGESEARMLAAHPVVGSELIANIPRLEQVAEIIRLQQKCLSDRACTAGTEAAPIPLGARILKAAIDYDVRRSRARSERDAVAELRMEGHCYDADVLDALEAVSKLDASLEIRECLIKDLKVNTIITENVTAPDGFLIVGKGQEVTPSLLQRLKNFAVCRGLVDDLRIRVREQRG
jgi:response regulator RpfG family c-di-GMP phosphodiesterase